MVFKSVLIVLAGLLVTGGVVVARRRTVNATAQFARPVEPGDGSSNERALASARPSPRSQAPTQTRTRTRSMAPLPSVALAAPAPVAAPEAPAVRRPASRSELIAGVDKGTEPPYLAAVAAAFGYLPELSDEEKATLLAIARKRVRLTRAKMKENPDGGGEPDVADSPDLAGMERTLLGEDRYRDYHAALNDVLGGWRSGPGDVNQRVRAQ